MSEGLVHSLKAVASLCGADSGFIIDIESNGKAKVYSTHFLPENSTKYISDIFKENKSPKENELLKKYNENRSEKDKAASLLLKRLSESDSRNLILILVSKEKNSFKNLTDKKLDDAVSLLMYHINKPMLLLEKHIRETTDNIDATIYSSDINGTEYYFVSNSIEKLLGYPSQYIYENRLAILRSILPEDFKKFRDFIAKVKAGESAVAEYRILNREKDIRYIRHSGTPIIEDGKTIRVVGMLSDITSEKAAMEKLHRSEELLSMLMKTTNSLIFTLNRSGYFIDVNPKGAQELGYNINELVGNHFLEFINEENRGEIAVAFQKILKSDEIVTFEAVITDRFGKSVVYEIQARSVFENNEITGMLGMGRDVTTKKKDKTKLNELNTKLTEANRIIAIERDRAKHQITLLEELNKLKNDFISNVSHELRTPLASIVGFAETISSDEDLPKEMVTEFSNIILTEGKRLARLINDILDFSKLESDKENLSLSSFDVIKLLYELKDSYSKQASDKGLNLTSELPEAEIIIKADRDRIFKAFSNLISNAIKFTPKDGRITIIAQDFLKEVEVMISDTGIGIPEEERPKLFQKFSKISNNKSQQPGAGFGLATVKQIVDLHKGLIQVKSEVNKGSTFIVRLPKSRK
ncbi:MAG: PAS domain-containing sensor histidine kinase [Melioribacteraceae bacterium]|nr:PAS domain-containing sensor histidine kinase [Melioribacteraceae bacterium]